ncbi:hypothetical protein [Jeotgalibacillus marinus]|uniref:Secreted protein n=1 Tax=Jeotgalibacillus marinus TaxID=86667 RepID=A0ABV3Q7I6_9BACL
MVMKKSIVGLSSFVLMGGILVSTDYAKAEVPTEETNISILDNQHTEYPPVFEDVFPVIPLDEWEATFELDNSIDQHAIIEHNGVEVGTIGLSQYDAGEYARDGVGNYTITATTNLIVGPYSNDNEYDYDFQEMGFTLYILHMEKGKSKIYSPWGTIAPWNFEEFLTMPHGFGQGWLVDKVGVKNHIETKGNPAKAHFSAGIEKGWQYEDFLADVELEVEVEDDEIHVKFKYNNHR